MHSLVIHEHTQKLIGRCHCGHWEALQNRMLPTLVRIGLSYTQETRLISVSKSRTSFKSTADVTRPHKTLTFANYLCLYLGEDATQLRNEFLRLKRLCNITLSTRIKRSLLVTLPNRP